MWLFTRYGFYSIACADKHDRSLDPGTVMVRARSIDHLRNLQERFPALAAGEILTWPKRDYRYRLILPKKSWVAIIAELAQEQEWSNFKDQAEEFQGVQGKRYVRALHDVWSVMYRLQESEGASR